jgi:hypothetical protein
MAFRIDTSGSGWIGWRGVYAVLLASPQFGLAVHWFTFGNISLGAGMFYFTLIPFMIAVALTAFLPGKSGLTPRTLGFIAVSALLPYTLYDWSRVPMNWVFGIPFWDHWFDWGNSIAGFPVFTYEALTVGLVAHAMRGWGFAAAYYVLVRKVTLLSSFVFAWVMTALYWFAFPIFILTDSLPPWIWWFTAWESHMFFALGLFFAPLVFRYYQGTYAQSNGGSPTPISVGRSPLFASRKGEILAILSSQGFGLMIGTIMYGYVGEAQRFFVPGMGGRAINLSIDPSVFLWAIPGAIMGLAFLAAAYRFRAMRARVE